MTSDQEGHHLIDKLFIGETTGLESHGDNVDSGQLLLFHSLTLAPDEISASPFNETVCFDEFLVSLVTT